MNHIKRFFTGADQSHFLFGPRGTGKSTWLSEHYPNAVWIDLLDAETNRYYGAYPDRLVDVVLGTEQPYVVIDEVQKLPGLLDVVHELIERKRGWQFVLTGSSARKLKRTGVDLLGGRALLRHLHPFMAAELGDLFDLDQALQNGLVPLVVASPNPKDTLRAYIGLYLREEVQLEGLVRNMGHFSRFLEIASFSHANVLNVSNIARECLLSRKLIDGYISILEDLLLAFRLSVFTRRAKRDTVAHPKFYYFDAGVFQHLRWQGPLDKTSEITGAALEGLVAQHLRAWNDYQSNVCKLYYWRTRSGNEVDFIVYGQESFWAIEVKNNQRCYRQDLRGLKAFCEDYPEATPMLLYRGQERLKIDGIWCLPVGEFLRKLQPGQPLICDLN